MYALYPMAEYQHAGKTALRKLVCFLKAFKAVSLLLGLLLYSLFTLSSVVTLYTTLNTLLGLGISHI